MLFNTPVFVCVFLPICLAGFYGLGRMAGNNWALRWLVACSLLFYGWWNPPFVLLLAGSIALNYGVGQRLLHLRQNGRDRAALWWLRGGLAADLGLLGWFKYAGFFADTLGLPHPQLFLPLAISFFTFQQVMFLVDSHRRDRQDLGFLPYAAFIAFFPHLIAGPIVRPREIIPQFTASDLTRPRGENLRAGLVIFLLGLTKKLVLADSFSVYADTGFNAAAAGHGLTMVEAWISTLSYALQIYFDFSGYSDMAIGLARMMNIRFPINFNSPYKSRNITEFWRRWHITLGNFLREYVYIGLGGNRRGAVRRDANLLATMLLGGLWHGAAWTFVLWGGLHGAMLVLHRHLRTLRVPFGRVWLLLAVVIAWVPFRANGIRTAAHMLRAMAGLNGIVLSPLLLKHLPAMAFIHAGKVAPVLGEGRPLLLPQCAVLLGAGWLVVLTMPHVGQMSARMQAAMLALGFGLAVQTLFFATGVAPFLYFQF